MLHDHDVAAHRRLQPAACQRHSGPRHWAQAALERSRNALLNFLAESLAEKQLSRTTVVFDAREAPPGLPRTVVHRGITVRFAPKGLDADDRDRRADRGRQCPAAADGCLQRSRLHRAARRRRAKAIDSDVWYAEVMRLRIERARVEETRRQTNGSDQRRGSAILAAQFGAPQQQGDNESASSPPSTTRAIPTTSAAPPTEPSDAKLKDAPAGNPFPPGTQRTSRTRMSSTGNTNRHHAGSDSYTQVAAQSAWPIGPQTYNCRSA